MWEIGKDWLLWDRINNGRLGNDLITYQYLRSRNVQNIPLVKEMYSLSAPTDKVQFTMMSRAKGVPLGNIWHTLSEEKKQVYRNQVTAALREMRQFTAPFPQKVDGTPLHDMIIGRCKPSAAKCKSIGKTKEEWFNNMADEIRYGISKLLKTKDETIIQERFQQLLNNCPDSGPCVLSHCDLNRNNIIVDAKNEKIEAIIDWEHAGFYPPWAERWFSLVYRHGDLMGPIWEELCPDVDNEAFWTAIVHPLDEVIEAWRECPIEHSDEGDIWFQPRFCKCQPYGGKIYERL